MPSATPPPIIAPRTAVTAAYPWRNAVLTICAVVLLLFARRPEAFLHPQFWAEDGQIFFVQADTAGKAALISPYNGYHHGLIRLVAGSVSWVNARNLPAFYAIGSTLLLAAIVLVLFSPRVPLKFKPALALSLVLLPQSGEAFAGMTNTPWITALALVLLLIADDARSARQWLVDVGCAGLVGLTGVFSILFLPLFVVRAALRRTGPAIALACFVLTAAAIQYISYLHFGADRGAPAPFDSALVMAATFGRRLGGVLFLSRESGSNAPVAISLLMGGLLTGALAFSLWRHASNRRIQIALLACTVMLLIGVTLRMRGGFLGLGGLNGDRYFFLPKALLLWVFIQNWVMPGIGRWFYRLAVAIAFVATLTGWRFERYRDYDWPTWAAKIEAGENVVVPLNPGVTFRHPGRHHP